MNRFFLFLIVFAPLQVWAYPCPMDFEKNSESFKIFSWLEHFQGQQAIGRCTVGITACDAKAERTVSGILGEIYVIDEDKREAYLPVLWAENNPRLQTELEVGSKYLHYVKYDYFFEEEYGRTEAYRLELRLNARGDGLAGLDLGTYATRKKLHSPDGNESRWYNCR